MIKDIGEISQKRMIEKDCYDKKIKQFLEKDGK